MSGNLGSFFSSFSCALYWTKQKKDDSKYNCVCLGMIDVMLHLLQPNLQT